jgi:hypothetical protein
LKTKEEIMTPDEEISMAKDLLLMAHQTLEELLTYRETQRELAIIDAIDGGSKGHKNSDPALSEIEINEDIDNARAEVEMSRFALNATLKKHGISKPKENAQRLMDIHKITFKKEKGILKANGKKASSDDVLTYYMSR